MNVLYISTYYNGGGAEKVMRQLYNGIVDYDNKDVRAFCMVGRYQKGIPENVEILHKSFLSRCFTTFCGMCLDNTLYVTPLARKKIIKYIKKNNIDIVHFHNLHSNYLGLLEIKKISNSCRKVVITMHDMWMLTGGCHYSLSCTGWKTGCRRCIDNEVHRRGKLSYIAWRIKKQILLSDSISVVTPAEWLSIQVREALNNKKKIMTIPNGMPMDVYVQYDKAKVRKELGITPGKKVLLYVSNTLSNVYKGTNFLPKILNQLPNKDQYVIYIIGNKPDEKIDLPIEFHLIGRLESQELMNKYYSSSDVFVMTSIAEVLPLVCIESLSSGTPVIAFDVGGISEIISEGGGEVVPLGDVDQYVEKLSTMVMSTYPDCRRIAEAKFSEQVMITSYLNIYRDLYGEE